MRLKEQRLWDRMRNNLPPDVYAERVENMLAAGFPDIILKATGGRSPVFCETKAVDEYPARLLSSRVFGNEGLSQEQKNWHMLWAKHGGLSIIVASCGSGAHLDHFAIAGRLGDRFNDMTRQELIDASYCKETRGTLFWAGLIQYLKGT